MKLGGLQINDSAIIYYCPQNYFDYTFLHRWSLLDIKDVRNSTSGVHDDEVAFYAGLFEANYTAPLIQQQWQNTMANYCSDHGDLCDSITKFIRENGLFLMSKLQNLNDPYWYQVSRLFFV